MASNSAAWLTAKQASPLTVKEAPLPTASDGHVVIKNSFVAINPVDYLIQDYGMFVQDYPMILGTDVAGTIHSTSSSSTFSENDRVIGHALSLSSQDAQDGGFQQYTRVPENLVAKLPDSVGFKEAVVLPLALSTASHGLYDKDFLNLPRPKVQVEETGKTVLIWGGSSSVGSVATQLAVSSGLKVITTASQANHDHCKSLGASQVFDHKSESIQADLEKAIPKEGFVGVYDAISTEASRNVIYPLLQKLGGGFVASVLPPPEEVPEGVKTGMIFAPKLSDEDREAVWREYLPEALAKGAFRPAPSPLVAGKGLENVQAGMDKLKAGVSAKKVVVEL